MLQSHVIEVEGAFVGAAVRQRDGFRFVAVDPLLDELDGQLWPSLDDVRRQTRAAYFAVRYRPAMPREAAIA